jgi:hypothetical protein
MSAPEKNLYQILAKERVNETRSALARVVRESSA